MKNVYERERDRIQGIVGEASVPAQVKETRGLDPSLIVKMEERGGRLSVFLEGGRETLGYLW